MKGCISLRALALRAGIERRRLLRQLEALERDPALHGMPVIIRAKGKTFVKLAVLELLHIDKLAARNAA